MIECMVELVFVAPALVEKFENDTSTDIPSVPLLKEALINCRQMEALLRILLVSCHSDVQLCVFAFQ